MVIPGGRGHGGQREEVAVIGAGIALRAVGAVVEVEDLREEDGAVEVDAALLQEEGEDGGAGGAVAFAEEELGVVPEVVFGEEAMDEAAEGAAVGIGSEESFRCVFAEDAGEARAGRVDEDEVAGVKEAVLVSDERVGRSFLMLDVGQHDAHGSEGAHVEIHGGTAWTAVVDEGDGAGAFRSVLFEVGDVVHARRGGLVFDFGGQVDVGAGKVFAVEADHGVLGVGGADGEGAGDGAVVDGLAADGDGAVGDGVGGEFGGFGGFGFGGV